MAEIFVGYLESRGKAPLSSVKDRSNWLKQPPETGDYVGILRDDVIQLDFDSEADSEIAMKIVHDYKLRCDVLKTTRGVHLYFIDDKTVKNQSVDIYNAIGLKCDIGLGAKNRVVPIRATKEFQVNQIVNGVETLVDMKETKKREWLQTYSELEELPPFFRPIGKKDYKLPKTTTRNQSLFTYILVLQGQMFTKEEIRKTIKIINKYILEEPLTDKEVDVITRDEAFSEEMFFMDGRFLHDRFGDYMLTNSNIVSIDGQVNIYTQDHVYSNDPMEFEKVMISKIGSLKDSQRKEVYKYIALKVTKRAEFSPPKYIGLKNEILDIETMESFPYAPKWVMNNRIQYEYNPSAYHELMDKTLDKVSCYDPQIRSLLEEMIGYSVYRSNSLQVAFILTGEGSNGKSTILNLVKKLLGKANYTSLDLRELEDNFKPSELYNKLANIGDDISAKYLETSSIFKKVVTGESFMVQRKFAQPFTLESYATQIFCANQLPNVNDHSDGFSRRLMIVPFNATFSKADADYDPFIETKLMEEDAMEYLLKIGLEGLKRALYNKKFTTSQKGEKEKEIYLQSNNNVLEWLEEEPNVENEPVAEVYMRYTVWCSMTGSKALKKINFSKEIKKYLNLVSNPQRTDGKTVRVYVKES